MDHIRLSPRLQMVADFVPPCTCAADIGTDHGYLPVWLLQNGIVIFDEREPTARGQVIGLGFVRVCYVMRDTIYDYH